MPDFIPGLELSRLFYVEAVKPILDAQFPDLRYDAALIGYGSEVLGFDTPMSRDHSWGPRLRLFLSADDLAHDGAAVDQALRRGLPHSFRGYPTSFVPDPRREPAARSKPAVRARSITSSRLAPSLTRCAVI